MSWPRLTCCAHQLRRQAQLPVRPCHSYRSNVPVRLARILLPAPHTRRTRAAHILLRSPQKDTTMYSVQSFPLVPP